MGLDEDMNLRPLRVLDLVWLLGIPPALNIPER